MGVGILSDHHHNQGSNYKHYPGKLTSYALITCLVAAMGGFIFGYDNGILGGVISMAPFFEKFFPSVSRKEALDTSTNQYCKFDDLKSTLFASSLYLAALVASFGASWVTRKLGRKISMQLGGLIFFAGVGLNAGTQSIWILILGRILLGIGLGFSIQSVPLYLSEMASCRHRGALNNVFQLAIAIGILVANGINYLTPKLHGGQGWRVRLGGACVLAAFIFISAFFLPNTPNSMLEKGQVEKAREMLKRMRGASDKEIEDEFQDLVMASKASQEVKHPWRNIFSRQYRPQLTMAVVIPCFQQLTGINVVMFYAPMLFESVGFGDDASLLSILTTGCINAAAAMISIYGIHKWGRRFLFLGGGMPMIIFQTLLVGWKFGVSGEMANLPIWYVALVVSFICIARASFACSWGPVGWLVPSEIFPLEIRSAAQSITTSTSMLFTFIIAQLFRTMLCHMKFGLFIFFAFFLVVMTLFVYFFVPETKGKPIEEMTSIWKEHWFWRRFMAEPKPSDLEIV